MADLGGLAQVGTFLRGSASCPTAHAKMPRRDHTLPAHNAHKSATARLPLVAIRNRLWARLRSTPTMDSRSVVS
jgi:hypothetical protein